MNRNNWRVKKINPSWLLLLAVLQFVWRTSSALECYSCDSAEDAECATKPGQQIAVEECLSETDECVQVVVSGTTRRGCLSRLFPSRYCPQPCERCSKSLCNRDIFPHERQRCYQCSGADCVKVENKPHLVLPCPTYKEDDRCYTNILHASNVIRGCESSVVDWNNCPNACLKCNRSGCNSVPGIWEQNCLECSHTTASPNPECWRGQEENADKCVARTAKYCQNKNFYGHEGKCFTYINEQTRVVNRGCSSSKPFYPTGNLTECYGENCNNDCLTISCNVCSSQDDPKCAEGRNLKQQKCQFQTDACYSCELGNQVRRGCADELLMNIQSTAAEKEVCYLCRDSDYCNRTPTRSCYSCSSLEHKQCATMSSSDSIPQQHCSSYDDLCVSTVISKVQLSYVLRGCSSHLSECTTNDPLCVRCNGSLCNNIPIDLRSTEVQKSKNNHFILEGKRSNGQRKYAWQIGIYMLIFTLCNVF